MKFDKYPISETIKQNLAHLGFVRTTDIQFKTIPSIMDGEDVLAIAQTGTGKTAAFAIPIIHQIDHRKNSKRSYGIQCIVMVPTHELAMQIGDVFTNLSKQTKVKTFAIYGGVEQDPQIQKLQSGLDVLITTPGRLFDLIHQGYVDLKRVETLVLDEADHMLDLGFIHDIHAIKRMLTQQHQTLFFSATINKDIKKLAYSQIRHSAIRIQISPDNRVSKNVTHYVMFVEMDDKRFFLERFMTDNPESRVIVFVRTRVRAERVAKAMGRVGIETVTIHGDKDQHDRAEVMKSFKAGACRTLIATDVSARGIDIPDVHYVINYDLPDKAENYVHRIGRTGRGINKGIALSFCSKEEKVRLEEIQGFLDKPIDVIKIAKEDYAFTLQHPSGEHSLEELMEEMDEWEKNKKRRKKKKT
ncbi:MAG: ATP-dependent RNA helicase RhlE [Nitrospirales bacterium]|nr:MAG: ATP-dependent RNA helicase RhlE [Nitrospirales bacterium]